MKIYEMMRITRNDGLFSSDSKETYWSLNATKDSRIVHSKKECDHYNTLYAIEHETNKMTLEYLLDVMYTYLSVEEINTICSNHEKLEQFLLAYLSGEKIKKELAKIKSAVESAENNADSAFVMYLLK